MPTQQMLDEARAAYHTLMTQGGLVKISHGVKGMEYSRQNAAELAGYISRLESQLGVQPTMRMIGRTPGRRIIF